jgi:hypothetical protein
MHERAAGIGNEIGNDMTGPVRSRRRGVAEDRIGERHRNLIKLARSGDEVVRSALTSADGHRYLAAVLPQQTQP